ncbi:MAG: hypothetical protein QOD75_4028 [Blastocatellia bacterium]|jgi:hypothetical protein|nr:hypothetical protein [Blastocatellia bacterium]
MPQEPAAKNMPRAREAGDGGTDASTSTIACDDKLSAASRALVHWGAGSWGYASLHPRLYAAGRFAGYHWFAESSESAIAERATHPLPRGRTDFIPQLHP